MFKRAVSKSTRPFWTPAGRTVVFLLAASSIGCLLGEFYQPDSMRVLALFVFLPAVAVLLAVTTGFAACFVAAVAYDLIRLPFVFAEPWGIDAIVPPLNLFKVFPAFGALILGHAAGQTGYTLADHITGWAYHFSNGMSF